VEEVITNTAWPLNRRKNWRLSTFLLRYVYVGMQEGHLEVCYAVGIAFRREEGEKLKRKGN
jgi:hypothetical protein